MTDVSLLCPEPQARRHNGGTFSSRPYDVASRIREMDRKGRAARPLDGPAEGSTIRRDEAAHSNHHIPPRLIQPCTRHQIDATLRRIVVPSRAKLAVDALRQVVELEACFDMSVIRSED